MPTLHDYQEHAIGYLRARKRAGLFLDMGLGKTATTLCAFDDSSLPALVNAPKRVAENVWEPERDKWRPDLSIAVAKGTPAQRRRALESRADIIVIGRDNLEDALPYAGRFRSHVIDELSGFKNHRAARYKVAKQINALPTMNHVWGLTGTPTPNGLMDLWAQLYLLDGGKRLGRTITSFRDAYYTVGKRLPNGTVIRWDIRPGAADSIMKSIDDICLSMETEGRIELPPVSYNWVDVPLPAKVRELYRKMKKEAVLESEFLGEIYSASTAAMVTARLDQIASGFLYPDDMVMNDREGEFKVLHTEKAGALQEIIDGSSGGVLVGYHFKAELAMLQKALGKQAHTIDEPDIVKRWNNGEIPVLLTHPQSAGHGLNLQHGGHTMVWHNIPWSLEEYQQLNKRLPRQGQQHPVVTHHLSSPNTVDVSKRLRLEGKKSVQQALMDHLASPL